jgi:hypothetical protein
MYIYQMSVNQMSVTQISVNLLSSGQMDVDLIVCLPSRNRGVLADIFRFKKGELKLTEVDPHQGLVGV